MEHIGKGRGDPPLDARWALPCGVLVEVSPESPRTLQVLVRVGNPAGSCWVALAVDGFFYRRAGWTIIEDAVGAFHAHSAQTRAAPTAPAMLDLDPWLETNAPGSAMVH